MTVQEVFEKYRILPMLQQHQLRVAAVGKTICDHFTERLDMQSVILACLFHDMGNIIKSDFSVFPEALEPLGRAHWERVKKEYVETYGESEHQAALSIARELGLSETVVQLIDGIGFSRMQQTRDKGSFELKIVEYSDCRVSPQGITSLDVRLRDAQKRYSDKYIHVPGSAERFEALLAVAHDIERELFAHTDLRPEELTEEALREVMESLREYKIA